MNQRQLLFAASMTAILFLAANAYSANVWWAGGDPVKGGTGNLWSNPQNWDPGGAPDASDSVWIEGYSSSIIPCVLDYSAPSIHWMWMQNYGTSVDAELNIQSGGSLNVDGNWYMGNTCNNLFGYAVDGMNNLDPNVFEIVGVEDFVDLITQAKP